jgi:plastocyanin
MKTKIINILPVVLLLLAFFVGYKLYNKSNSLALLNDKSVVDATPKPRDLSQLSDEDLVLVTPLADASEDEKKKYEELVRRLSKESEEISLHNCKSTPVVSAVRAKKILKFKNTDASDHTLIFYNDKTLVVKKNSSAEITLDYGQGHGVYAYGCDESIQPTGILYVVE